MRFFLLSMCLYYKKSVQNHKYDVCHLTMTFSGLNALLALDDDLSRIDKKSMINGLRELQREDGRLVPLKISLSLIF